MKELVFVFKACYRMYRGSGKGRHSMLSALVLSVRDTAHLYGFTGTYAELPVVHSSGCPDCGTSKDLIIRNAKWCCKSCNDKVLKFWK